MVDFYDKFEINEVHVPADTYVFEDSSERVSAIIRIGVIVLSLARARDCRNRSSRPSINRFSLDIQRKFDSLLR